MDSELKNKILKLYLSEDYCWCEECEKEDYLVCTDKEADEAVTEYIKKRLRAFNAAFILNVCGLDGSGTSFLKSIQEKLCENANDFLLSLVKGTCSLEHFIECAVNADGRGHFLSSYDGIENEIELDGEDYYIYRISS